MGSLIIFGPCVLAVVFLLMRIGGGSTVCNEGCESNVVPAMGAIHGVSSVVAIRTSFVPSRCNYQFLLGISGVKESE